MHDENTRYMATTEDEYVEHCDGSFVSQKSDDGSRRSTSSMIDAVGQLQSPTPFVTVAEEELDQNGSTEVLLPQDFEEDFLRNIRSCFHLEGNMLLLAMRDFTIVMSEDMEALAITNFKTMFGTEFKGQAQCFRSDSTGDDNSILIGFNDAYIP